MLVKEQIEEKYQTTEMVYSLSNCNKARKLCYCLSRTVYIHRDSNGPTDKVHYKTVNF